MGRTVRKSGILTPLCLVIAALMAPTASAAAVPRLLCLNLDIGSELYDASTPTRDFFEEYGRATDPFPAIRTLAYIEDIQQNTLFGWAPLDRNGCALLASPTGNSGAAILSITYTHWSIWQTQNNHIVGLHCTEDFCLPKMARKSAILFEFANTPLDPVVVSHSSQEQITPPFWSMTFSEERYFSRDLLLRDNSTVYVAYEDIKPKGTSRAGWFFGYQPSVILTGESWHSKFTAAHEYGHIQTFFLEAGPALELESILNYCSPSEDPGTCGHDPSTIEWSAAAAIEGFASYYAMSVWHDISPAELTSSQEIQYVYLDRDDKSGQVIAIPKIATSGQTVCNGATQDECGPGQSNEWDWARALVRFQTNAHATPAPDVLLRMLIWPLTDNGTWPAVGQSDAFWTQFDSSAQMNLSPSEHEQWIAAANRWSINQ